MGEVEGLVIEGSHGRRCVKLQVQVQVQVQSAVEVRSGQCSVRWK